MKPSSFPMKKQEKEKENLCATAGATVELLGSHLAGGRNLDADNFKKAAGYK